MSLLPGNKHLTFAEAYKLAREAGFNAAQALIIISIAAAESGLNSHVLGNYDPRDRGILQINSYWHPEVLDSCAQDPACAFRAAYQISDHGTNFGAWRTFTKGSYKAYMGSAQKAEHQSTQPTQPAHKGGLTVASLTKRRRPVSPAERTLALSVQPQGIYGATFQTQPHGQPEKWVTVQAWPHANSTLSDIARRHGISLQRIEQLNPQISNFDLLQPGEKVRIS